MDGFILKQDQKHQMLKMWTGRETAMSDHRPKILEMKIGNKKWRRGDQERREPQIDHEALRDEKFEKYEELTKTKYRQHQGEYKEDSTNWNTITEILTTSARETCANKQTKKDRKPLATREIPRYRAAG